jgi:aspartate aminotransferase-like enzyme
MTSPVRDDSLLDRDPVTAAEVAGIERAAARLLATGQGVVLVQGEAILTLEAAALGLGRPGLRALNIVTGPYGAIFGRWLARTGAELTGLEVPFDHTVSADQVAAALSGGDVDLVALVHAEAATGGANPVGEIAELVRAAGALLVVDAVASIGAQPVTPDGWDADIVVIGPQKALAGPAGVSAVSVSERAWAAMEANPSAPRESMLSLLDLRHGWLDAGRSALLGTPGSLETRAFGQALRRVESEGTASVIARHRAAAAATRAGARALGLAPWIADDRAAATVVTTLAAPPGTTPTDLSARARRHGSRLLAPAPGALADRVLRVGHTGRGADLAVVLGELTALAAALGRDAAEPVRAAEHAWAAGRP